MVEAVFNLRWASNMWAGVRGPLDSSPHSSCMVLATHKYIGGSGLGKKTLASPSK